MQRFIIFFVIITFHSINSKAQIQPNNLKILFQKDVNPSKLILVLDNGLNETIVKFSELDIQKEVNINTECHAEYLKITIIGLFKEDKFENYEVFYCQNPSASIEFSKNANFDSNQIYNIKLINIEERKNMGENKFKDYISSEITKSVEIRKQYSLNPNDSLKQITDSLGMISQSKTFEFISKNASLFYSKELFHSSIDNFHHRKSKSELLSFYEKTFEKSFQQSPFGKRVYEKIINLELNYGSLAPNITTIDINGNPFELKNHLGKYVLINFWATWCKPCILEMPVLKQIRNGQNPNNFELISISSDEDKVAWAKFIRKSKYSWTHILDTDNISELWRVVSIPKVFMLDKTGRIIYSTDIDEDYNLEDLKILVQKLDLNKK